MLARDILSSDEKELDSQLGYPRGYGKLCRHAHIQMQGLITPFTEGPPQRFLPYAPLDEELAKVREYEALFPIVEESERDPSNARRYSGYLWQQLDHLGNAGLDPTKFRVDAYGNVLYWNADSGSPLAWEVDHWFPHSRGGRTVVGNLRIVQWQVNQRKSTKLEFLVPWWDLQLGVSVNQFLSVFSSKNVDFRQRAFSLFFVNGENEELDENLVVECHSWPQPFRERKHQVGLAAAAIVRVQKPMDDTLRALNSNRALIKQSNPQTGGAATPARRRWTRDEEDALKRALQKFGPGNWKEIKEFEPLLVNRSTVQIKDKYRLLKGEWDKENREEPCFDRHLLLKKEEQLKQARAEERKRKEENLFQLEAELQQVKDHNEKEKVVLEDLEHSLAKQRKRVEKLRKWSETQSQYRQCLEKMIRDTIHQCVLFKEQARLNQAACNALFARLESQKSACDWAEMDMMKRVKQRETLEALARPKITKRTRKEGHVDVGGFIKLNVGSSEDASDEKASQKVKLAGTDRCKGSSMHQRQTVPESWDQDSPTLHGSDRRMTCYSPSDLHGNTNDLETENMCAIPAVSMKEQKYSSGNEADADGLDTRKTTMPIKAHVTKGPGAEDGANQCSRDMKNDTSSTESNESASLKRKATEVNDLDVEMLRYELGESESRRDDRDNINLTMNREVKLEAGTTKDDQQLDELLQEVLEMKGKVTAAMEDAIEDEEDEQDRIKRAGKFNLDKWLQVLLLPSKDGNGDLGALPQLQPQVEDCPEKTQGTVSCVEADKNESIRGGMLKDSLRKMSLKEQGHVSAEGIDATLEAPRGDELVKETTHGRGQVSLRSHTTRCVRSASPSRHRMASPNVGALQQNVKTICHEKDSKSEERKVIESFSRLKLGGDGPCPNVSAESSAENPEVAFQIACETEFVEKMRAVREREQRRKMLASAGMRPQLQDLMADSTSPEPSQEQEGNFVSSPSLAFAPSPASRIESKADIEQQRRFSTGGLSTKPQNQFAPARHQSSLSPFPKKPQLQQHAEQQLKQSVQHLNPQQSLQQQAHSILRNPQQNSQHPRQHLPHPIERSSSTPPGGQCRQVAVATSPAHYAALQSGREQTEEEHSKKRQPSGSRGLHLVWQLAAGHAATVAGAGGVVQKT